METVKTLKTAEQQGLSGTLLNPLLGTCAVHYALQEQEVLKASLARVRHQCAQRGAKKLKSCFDSPLVAGTSYSITT